MNNSEEIHELDQSPHAYTVVHGAVSENNKILIEDIKLRYGYKGDLFYHLITLPSWVNSYTDVKRQRGRAKTQKALYMKTMKAAEKLQEYMGYFSGRMRGEMQDILKKENRFAAFSAIENNLPFLINQCRYKALSTPKDIGGQQSGSLPKDLIWFLMQQYEFHAEREATCGWVELNDEHVGEFYQFIVELKPIIAAMDIELGENRTVGQYTRELLTSRSKTRKKLSALIITILNNLEFFACNCLGIASFFLASALDKLYFLRSPHFAFTQD